MQCYNQPSKTSGDKFFRASRGLSCSSKMDESEELSESKKTAVGPPSVLSYLDPKYWNDRFTGEEHYEWLKDYSHFRHLIQQHIRNDSSVLELGCGNSQLSDELYKEGITDLTCIDLSSVAVEKMQKRLLSKGYKDIKVLEGDMLNLSFASESFDVVIEKGTMDVLFVDSGDPWNPRPEAVNRAMAMLRGTHRVLKPDGIFISIAFGQPHFRRPLFNAPELTWSVEHSTFGDGFHYFFYVLRKGRRSLETDTDNVKVVDAPCLGLFHDELDNEDYIFRTNIDEMDDDRRRWR